MKILIVGASSYVGARIYWDFKDKHELLGTYANNRLSEKFIQLDITDEEQVKKTIVDFKPEIIVHVANNASSKWCDENPQQAILLNQTATEYIVRAADEISAKLIYISSLVVINPGSLYGKTKLASEEIAKKTKAEYLLLRPSLILGYSPNTANDRPFNRILKNLDEKTPAVYEDAWNFQPTYIGHISEIIETCLEKNIWQETISITVPEFSTRYKCARDILTPFNVQVKIDESVSNLYKDTMVDLEPLKRLGLPTWNYQKMIDAIVDEIKKRDKFVM